MNLFDAELRSQINQVQKNIFDSFKRTLTFRFYLQAKEVVVYDPNYMADFDEVDGNNNIKQVVSSDFPACIVYLERQEFSDFIKGDDSNIRFKGIYNRIRIQVEADAFEFMKDAVGFEFDGQQYAIEQSWSKLGLLADFPIFQIILQRIV
jgi:hypothetical protein